MNADRDRSESPMLNQFSPPQDATAAAPASVDAESEGEQSAAEWVEAAYPPAKASVSGLEQHLALVSRALSAEAKVAAGLALADELVGVAARLVRASYDDDAERLAAALGKGSLSARGIVDRLRAALSGGSDQSTEEVHDVSPGASYHCPNCFQAAGEAHKNGCPIPGGRRHRPSHGQFRAGCVGNGRGAPHGSMYAIDPECPIHADQKALARIDERSTEGEEGAR